MEILERFAQGDLEAFEALFRQFQGEGVRLDCAYRSPPRDSRRPDGGNILANLSGSRTVPSRRGTSVPGPGGSRRMQRSTI